jgi:hypothetical protein
MGNSKATAADAPQLVEALLRAWPSALPAGGSVRSLPEAKPLFASAGAVRTAIILALLPLISRTWDEKVAAERTEEAKPVAQRSYRTYDAVVDRLSGLHKLLADLLRGADDISARDADALFEWIGAQGETHLLYLDRVRIMRLAEQLAAHHRPGKRMRAGLAAIRVSLSRTPTAANLRLIETIDRLRRGSSARIASTPRTRPSSVRTP